MKQLIPIILFLTFSIAIESLAQKKFGGLALYTVRDDMGKDPKATLQAVATVGYEHIEAAGYRDRKFYGMTPEDFMKTVTALGLTPLSAHQGGVTFENADNMIADVKAAGFKYFVIPIPPMGHFRFNRETRSMYMSDSVEFVSDIINTIGKKCHDAGLQLLYHNHDFEFKPNSRGVVPIEYFIEHSNPEHVNFQMDLFWVTNAGADPISYFKKYPGRFKSWHVKDMDTEGRFAPVGSGTIDFKKILEHKELSGMEYYMVEQDMTFGIKPLEAIRVSHEGLKKFGFK
jgi:sugar phosphate isomerase/epimerase